MTFDVPITAKFKVIATKDGYMDSEITTIDVVVERASRPTASPTPGTVSAGTAVTLSTATAGAAIRYTTNGTAPDLGATLYSSPITIATTTTIRVRVYKNGMAASETATFAYDTNTATRYTVSFYANGGTGSMARQTFTARVGTVIRHV
jgi:hypothetical protein